MPYLVKQFHSQKQLIQQSNNNATKFDYKLNLQKNLTKLSDNMLGSILNDDLQMRFSLWIYHLILAGTFAEFHLTSQSRCKLS